MFIANTWQHCFKRHEYRKFKYWIEVLEFQEFFHFMNFTIPFRSQLVQPEPPVGEDNEDTDTEEEDDQSVILLDETLLERPQLQE